MADIATLIFLLQQLGIALGLGAATFSLFFYIMSTRDGVVDTKESQFIHATNTVLVISLFLIVATGALITGAHFLAGEIGILMTPVFISKWLLIIIIMLNAILQALKAVTKFIGATVSGASWYALFVIHTQSPDVSWDILGLGYVLWLGIFALGFFAIKKGSTTAPVRTVVQKKLPVQQKPPQKKNETRVPVSKYASPVVTPVRTSSASFDLRSGLAEASSTISMVGK